MWKWILNPSYGSLNGLLYSLGIIEEYIVWLGTPKLSLFVVILADVWKETPFIMLLFLAALQTIPKDLYEAAMVDGSNAFQSLFRITIPLISPTLFVALSLRTIWALKSFDLIYTLTAGVRPGERRWWVLHVLKDVYQSKSGEGGGSCVFDDFWLLGFWSSSIRGHFTGRLSTNENILFLVILVGWRRDQRNRIRMCLDR